MSGPGSPSLFDTDKDFHERWLKPIGQLGYPVKVWAREDNGGWHGILYVWKDRMHLYLETTWSKAMWQEVTDQPVEPYREQ